MRRAALALFACFLLAVGFACAVYGPSLLEAADAGPDATAEGGADSGAESGCVGATWPGRPAADDPAAWDGGDVVVAVSALDVSPDAGGGNLRGWNLDRTCTCPGAPSCNPGDAAIFCDDALGRDNSAAILFADLGALGGGVFDSTKISSKIVAGEFSVVLRLLDYNGAANDRQVTAAIFASPGTTGVEDGGNPTPPKFDGTDVWTIDPATLFGGNGPPYVSLPDTTDTAAYVSGGVLVASLNQVIVSISGTSVPIFLTGATVTARVSPNGSGGFRLDDGLLSGRWPSGRLLTGLSGVKDPLMSGTYLCGDSGTYLALKRIICDGRDIVAAVQNDNTGAPCDALSISIGFTAVSARMGAVHAKTPPTAACGATWDDDCAK